ncbi:MAG: peptidase M64 N-terminal domain-containing protein, partial [Bacteroidales bacterium]|nr:peptidase M64 N-terminal domain-containing protein [Bacteroidales bacterium]
MKRIIYICIMILPNLVFAQWEENFENASLRIDYYHSGRYQIDYFTIQSYQRLDFYSGSHIYLIDETNNGAYKVALFDKKTKRMIFSKGFSSLFNEWQSSGEAKRMCGNYEETVIVPYPKNEVELVFYSRDSINNWHEVTREDFKEDLLVENEVPLYNIISLHPVNRKLEERMDLVFL